MNIAFDASILRTKQPTGVEKTFRSLLLALSRRGSAHRFFLMSPGSPPEIPGISGNFEPVSLGREAEGPLWRERLLPAAIREREIDLFHSPVSAFPLLAPCRKFATVHEIPWLEPGTGGDEGRRPPHRLWAFLAASYANRILCVSRRTAENLCRLYPAAREKVRVVYHGVDSTFRPVASPPDSVLRKYGLPRSPFFLCVGRARAKKNLVATVRAFRVFLDRTAAPHCLVLAGPGGLELTRARERAEALGIGRRVLAPGYLSEEDLPAIYSRAEALLYLSFSEGFGLPPLEAMACGTPVIASDRGAIPEVTGEAAVLVPPDDPMAVAEAMRRLVAEPVFRAARVEEGKRQAARFRWEEAAETVLALYEETLGEAARSKSA